MTLLQVDSTPASTEIQNLRSAAKRGFSTTDLTKTPVDQKSPFGDDITATIAVFELDAHGVPQQAYASQPTLTFSDWGVLPTGQFYVSPVEVVVPGGAQSLVVIELGVGDANKQSIAWKIDTRKDIRVDGMGPYGGAAFYEVHSTLAVPTLTQVPIPDPDGDRSKDRAQLQATFSMSNAVTQSTPQTSPAFSAQAQFGFSTSPDSKTTPDDAAHPDLASTTKVVSDPLAFAVSAQFGPFGWMPIRQSSPPAAVFAVSFNAFVTVQLSPQQVTDRTQLLATLPTADALQTVLDFGADGNTTVSADELQALWDWVASLGVALRRAIRTGDVTVRVRASASPTGEHPPNVALSQARASAVRVALQGSSISGVGTTGGFLGSEQVKIQLVALGTFELAAPNLRTGPVANGKQAKVFIDRDEASASIIRQLYNPPPGP